MERTKLGHSDIECSRIGLGTWAMGGWMWGGTDEARSLRTIAAALDHGIDLIDTAPAYGAGRAEELVGKALAGSGRRAQVVIATQVGLELDGGVRRNSRPARIREELEGSLRRLRTDHIDLYQVHWPDPATPFEETGAALHELLRAGKIRAIGVSNFSPEQLDRIRRTAPVHAAQPPYNLFERDAERDVLPYCRKNGIVTLTYGALCRGLLSGRMRPDTRFEGDDLRKIDPKFKQPRYGQYLRAVEALDELARKRFGKRVIHLALRWALDRPGVGVALWGARGPEQLDPVEGVLGWHLEPGDLSEIDRIVAENVTDPVGPEFMAPPPAAPEARA